MFFRSRALRRRNREIVDTLYSALTIKARRPELFIQCGLPDTVMGRFESLAIQMFLFLRRGRRDEALKALTQDVLDRFMLDIDQSIRELGIGDQSVPKRMRKLAGVFYERVAAYETALGDIDPESALSRCLLGRAIPAEIGIVCADRLARLILDAEERFSRVATETILAGRIEETVSS